jgi:hypothetical protein
VKLSLAAAATAAMSCLALLLSASPASADVYVKQYNGLSRCVSGKIFYQAMHPSRDYYCRASLTPGDFWNLYYES